MTLNETQLATLKAAIIADPNLAAARAIHSSVGTQMIADYLNTNSDLTVWRTSVQTQVLLDSITWANLTMNYPPDGTLEWLCRSESCRGKQSNIDTILGSRETINPSLPNIRAGLQDALTNVYSVNPASQPIAAGWVAVRAAMQRLATKMEKIFADTQSSPGSLVVEGQIDEFTIRKLAFADNGDWLL